MKSGALWEHCRWLVLADFGRDPRSSDSWRARRNYFVSGKQRTISPISRRPNFTKFEHNTSTSVAIKTFGTEFWKFYRKGFFSKSNNSQKMFNVLRLQAAITLQWLHIDGNLLPNDLSTRCLVAIFTVGINGQYSPYTKRTPKFSEHVGCGWRTSRHNTIKVTWH